jgi:hypothetical protein
MSLHISLNHSVMTHSSTVQAYYADVLENEVGENSRGGANSPGDGAFSEALPSGRDEPTDAIAWATSSAQRG